MKKNFKQIIYISEGMPKILLLYYHSLPNKEDNLPSEKIKPYSSFFITSSLKSVKKQLSRASNRLFYTSLSDTAVTFQQ